jgi:hypothetical protein
MNESNLGVQSVSANLSTKQVAVTCNDEVNSSMLLEALKKWSGSSGKLVELLA